MFHIFVIFSSFILSFASAIRYECGNSSSSKSNDWDYLTYAQQWPVSFCLSQSGKCNIPADVTYWTIHGLWPSSTTGEHPEFCYYPQVFDDSTIKELVGEMNRTWPNLILENPFTSFWQHEWCKHGTCAENSAAMKGEVNYFKKGLDLHDQISIDSALEAANIFPGKYYSLSNITNAITKKFNVKVLVLCFHDSEKNLSILQQVEICLDKNFNLMDCPGSPQLKYKRLTGLGECSSKHDLFYPPMKKYTITLEDKH